VPRLAEAHFGAARATDEGLLTAHWRMGNAPILQLLANLSDREVAHPAVENAGTLIWGSELKGNMPPLIVPPWAVSWRIG